MKDELSLKESQDVELETMQKLHEYCEKHGLRYLLAFGSLIGAIRHKGFIPWDNDMDVYMPRPDFEKLLEISASEPIGEDLYVTYYTLDEKYFYNCIRICDDRTEVKVPYIPVQPSRMGVWVDIFAVDGLPKGRIRRKIIHFKSLLLYYAFRANVYGTLDNKNLLRKILKKIVVRIVPNSKQQLNRLISSFEKKYSFYDYDESAIIFAKDMIPIPQSDFDDPMLVDYEKYKFKIPKHYDKILTEIYGDYMQLPDESQRHPHEILAYWK